MRESSLNFNRRSPLTERAQLTLSGKEKKKEREREGKREIVSSRCATQLVDEVEILLVTDDCYDGWCLM